PCTSRCPAPWRAHPSRSPLFPYTTLFRSCTDRICSSLQVFIVLDRRIIFAVCLDMLAFTYNKRIGVVHALLILEGYCILHTFLRSEEHTSELQSRFELVCRLLLEKIIHSR